MGAPVLCLWAKPVIWIQDISLGIPRDLLGKPQQGRIPYHKELVNQRGSPRVLPALHGEALGSHPCCNQLGLMLGARQHGAGKPPVALHEDVPLALQRPHPCCICVCFRHPQPLCVWGQHPPLVSGDMLVAAVPMPDSLTPSRAPHAPHCSRTAGGSS